MKIIIKMVSGEKITFYNDKYKTLEDWVKGNFKGDSAWFKPSNESKIILRFENMETIRTEDEDGE